MSYFLLTCINRAFVKLSQSDGFKAEEIDILIGKTITINPTNFLKAYRKNRATVTRLDALVGNLGPELVDNFPRQAIEIQKRINSLKTVKSQQLKSLATECIEQLEKELKVINH